MKKSRSYNEVRGKSSKKSKYHTEGNLETYFFKLQNI